MKCEFYVLVMACLAGLAVWTRATVEASDFIPYRILKSTHRTQRKGRRKL
jgi:hypothetical protein